MYGCPVKPLWTAVEFLGVARDVIDGARATLGFVV